MSVTSSGFPEAIDKLLRASDRTLIHRGVTRAAHVFQKQAKIAADFAIQNGAQILGKTIIVVDNPGTLSADIGPTWIGSRLTELGGIVRPVHKKVLSWWVTPGVQGGYKSFAQAGRSKAGRAANMGAASYRVFALETYHHPHPYMRPALWASRDLMAQAMLEPLGKIFGQQGGSMGGSFEVSPE